MLCVVPLPFHPLSSMEPVFVEHARRVADPLVSLLRHDNGVTKDDLLEAMEGLPLSSFPLPLRLTLIELFRESPSWETPSPGAGHAGSSFLGTRLVPRALEIVLLRALQVRARGDEKWNPADLRVRVREDVQLAIAETRSICDVDGVRDPDDAEALGLEFSDIPEWRKGVLTEYTKSLGLSESPKVLEVEGSPNSWAAQDELEQPEGWDSAEYVEAGNTCVSLLLPSFSGPSPSLCPGTP